MAFVITATANFPNNTAFDVISNADADTTPCTITHNFGSTVVQVALIPLLDNFFTARWFVASLTANTVVLTKSNAVGSSNAAAQLRVLVRPYDDKGLVPHYGSA